MYGHYVLESRKIKMPLIEQILLKIGQPFCTKLLHNKYFLAFVNFLFVVHIDCTLFDGSRIRRMTRRPCTTL